MRPEKRRKKEKRRNPVSELPQHTITDLGRTVGNLMVQQAVADCTYQEKVLVAILIPLLLPIVKQTAAGMTTQEASDAYDQAETIMDATRETVENALRRGTPGRDKIQ